MDNSVVEGVGRALKKIYACDVTEQLPARWLVLLAQLDERAEGVSPTPTSGDERARP